MLANQTDIQDLLTRLQALEEKIRFAEKIYRCAIAEKKPEHVIRRLKMRLRNLQKERCLYYTPMQKLKPYAGFQSFLYNKIESLPQFSSSRFA